jgi:hypothetical protein
MKTSGLALSLEDAPVGPSPPALRQCSSIRYRIFGVQESCRPVSAEEGQRFPP